MWERIRFHPEPCDAPRLRPALEELRRTHCNGNAHLYRFRIPEDPIFDGYASRNQLEEMEFFENRHDKFLMFENGQPWCSWFCDIAWDRTWLILDKGTRRVWLLCLTDTD